MGQGLPKKKRRVEMVQLEWIFLLQLAIGVWVLILLQRTNKIQKQLDGIINEVRKYVDFVTEEDSVNGTFYNNIEETDEREEYTGKKLIDKHKKTREEAQNHLIQAVLQEYFP